MTTDNPNPADAPAAADTAAVANTDSTTATAPSAGEGQGDAGTTAETTTTTTEAAAEGDKAADEAGKEGDADGVPEKYQFELPEGYVLEGERLEMVETIARTEGWSQAKAQEKLGEYLKLREGEREAERGLYAQMSVEEFGENFQAISDGVVRIRPEIERLRPGFTERMDATNLGNHPDVLWLISQYGEMTRERPMLGISGETRGTGLEAPLESRMYPGMSPK